MSPVMVMEEINFKEIANGKIAARFKQVGVLIIIIVIGILISLAIKA
jgi:hypothetical protein